MSTRITLAIHERADFAPGHTYGDAGAYERVTGRVDFAVDPQEPGNTCVVDLDKAPADAQGLVHFSADFCLLKPVDIHRGNGGVFFDYGNRGNKRALQFFNDAPGSNAPQAPEHAGNGYLMRRGYTIAWLGWQGDLLAGDGRLVMKLPVATDGGKPITGSIRIEYTPTAAGTYCLPLNGFYSTDSYPAVSLDTRQARLTRRQYATSERLEIPADQWAFARLEVGSGNDNQGVERAVVPSDKYIYLPAGFEPGWIYEIVYTARDPLVLGLGHVAVRDFIAFLKYAQADAAGTPNPVRQGDAGIQRAYAWGRSQAGRCIRDFLHLGFNADHANRRVFDGVMPHVAGGGKMWMNHRFANVIILPGQEFENHYAPADRFPFAYGQSKDHLTGVGDAILKRPDTDPHVIHTDTCSEFWQRRGSLVLTDTQGNDLPLPDNVRAYFWASSQHFASPLAKQATRELGQNFGNVVVTSMFFRALLDALDAWVKDGVAPPPSRTPSRAAGTLVPYAAWREQFPTIPGVMVPRGPSGLENLDHGPDFERGIANKNLPDVLDGEYTVLVPAVDADGNDVAGMRAPMAAVPLGTYTGWNLRRRELGAGALVGIAGSYIPFPDTVDERLQVGDPRPSVLERYGDAAGYSRAVEAAARALVEQRLMLEEDVARAVTVSRNWSRPLHVVRIPA